MPTGELHILRTDESRFARLADFPYKVCYREWENLRAAHIDEGPVSGRVALLIHGEPTWSYLYRHMIPGLLDAGYRVVAPDHVGFGRSDKPVDDDWYTVARHVAALRHLIETLDLRRITLFVQDWGGPIGLRQVTTMPERFERLVILNTWLHHEGFRYSQSVRSWRERALDPDMLGGDMPIGRIVAGTLQRAEVNRAAAVIGYDAPFPGPEYKAGPRRFPFCLPYAEPLLGQAREQAQDFARLPSLPMPKHLIFGDADPIFPVEWGRAWAAQLTGSTFDTVAGAGHFLQEEAGAEIISTFLKRSGGA